MKKKSNIYKIFMLIIIAAAGSCTNLSVPDYSDVVKDNFKPTADDIPSIVAPVYTIMRPMWAGWQGNFDLQEESADCIVTPARPNGWYDGGTYQHMHKHTWTATQWQPENLWNNCYNGINTANRVIYQIQSGQVPIEDGKDALIAELKTVRAFYYYELCDNFGNVPIVTDFTSTDLPKQSTRKEVYDFIIKKLKDNIPLLSEEANASTYGRFNKWAAITLLAKIYLNAGVYTGTPEWDKCIAQCNMVINSEKYILAPNYKDNFVTENENCPELIFAVPYDEKYATENQIAMKTLQPIMQKVYNMQAQPWGGDCAVPQFIDTYDKDDGRLKDTWIMGPQVTPAGDTVITYVNYLPDITLAQYNQGFRIGKYEIKMGAKGGLSNDFPVFRYADVLLMKAECLLRTGHADEAAAIVSHVRERDFKTHPEKAKVTGAELLQGSTYDYGYVEKGEIVNEQGGEDIKYGGFLDELGWEFAAEAHRRQDLIRFGVYSTKMWFQHKPVGNYTQLFPIAEDVLNSNPNLKQNKGY